MPMPNPVVTSGSGRKNIIYVGLRAPRFERRFFNAGGQSIVLPASIQWSGLRLVILEKLLKTWIPHF